MEIILFQHSVLGGCFQAGKKQHAPWFFFKGYNPRETEFHYQTMQITQQPVCHWLYLDFFLHSEHFWPSAGSRQAGTCGFCPHKAWTEEGEPLVKVTARHLCALELPAWDFCMNSLGQRLKHRSQTQKFWFLVQSQMQQMPSCSTPGRQSWRADAPFRTQLCLWPPSAHEWPPWSAGSALITPFVKGRINQAGSHHLFELSKWHLANSLLNYWGEQSSAQKDKGKASGRNLSWHWGQHWKSDFCWFYCWVWCLCSHQVGNKSESQALSQQPWHTLRNHRAQIAAGPNSDGPTFLKTALNKKFHSLVNFRYSVPSVWVFALILGYSW